VQGVDVSWVRACRLEDLREGKGVALTLAGEGIALFLVEGRVFALEDRCPHRGAALSRGLIQDRCLVACLDHGWSVSLLDGRVQPPEQGQARCYATKVVDGEVLVELPVSA